MATTPIRVLLVDDHKMIRDGIRALLDDVAEIQVVDEADNGKEALDLIRAGELKPDVVVMDVRMPEMSGIEATRIISEEFPDLPVLSLSMHDEVEYISKMLQAGAHGYMLKNAGKQELVMAIKKVATGEKYFSSEVSYAMMMNYIAGDGKKDRGPRDNVQLTKREEEIIKLIASEMTNQEIADKLSISLRTVDTHRRNLLQKLGVKNTAGLVRFAIQQRLID
ncbi:MAG: response regulator transcription factor [Bacteroidia bacterium]|nr:response regulator transcription factor [Bacteroidia bacterium]